MAMLDGIVMDIIHMILIIPLIANGMFPVSSLPDTAFGFANSALEMRSVFGMAMENRALIKRHRVE